VAGVVIGIGLLGGLVVTKWSIVKEWPPAKPLLTRLSQAHVPTAKAELFSVLVAHLENDPDEKNEKFVVDTLAGLRGVEVLRLDRTISATGPRPQDRFPLCSANSL
jgi:hypothetical protein